jgi:hypothetical protein
LKFYSETSSFVVVSREISEEVMRVMMEDTPDFFELRQRAEKKLDIALGSTEGAANKPFGSF